MRVATALVLALMLAAPMATAGWRANPHGLVEEPNTAWDRDAAFQHQGPNQAPVDRVYFDAWTETWGHPPVADPSNLDPALPRTAATSFAALLGYWRDCNRDGFVGDALSGAIHYPVALLDDTSLCPSGPYNDGLWVAEFLPIGPDANAASDQYELEELCDADLACFQGQPNAVRDDAAKVWHDWGTPVEPPAVAPLYPFPPGTLDDTGGHFAWLDAVAYHRLSGCDDGWADGACGLWPAHNPLVPNVANPVTATARERWVGDTGSEGRPIVEPWQRGPGPDGRCELRTDTSDWKLDTNGGLYPTIDHPWRSAVWPLVYSGYLWYEDPEPGRLHHACSRHPSNELLGGFGYPEGRPDGLGQPQKVRADTTFVYVDATYYNPSRTGHGLDTWLCVPDDVDASGTPTRCTGAWYATSQWLHPPGLSRFEPRPLHPAASTFYADVNFDTDFDPWQYNAPAGLDDEARALPAGNNDAHTYGWHECDDGVSTQWDCDPQAWLDAVYGDGIAYTDALDRHRVPKVGDAYDLRDVECGDGLAAHTLPTHEPSCVP